jgi:Ca-activated chloride channel family protein
MMIGERRVIGFIHEKEEARKIYEQAKQSGQATALVEQHRPKIFKTSVANIPPRSMIAIEIQYQTDIALDSYDFSFRMPMAITPRFDIMKPQDMISLVSDAGQDWAKPVIEKMYLTDFKGGVNPVHLQANLNTGFDTDFIKSTTHKVTMKTDANGLVSIKPSKEIIAGEQDFKLAWRPLETDKTFSSVYTEKLDDTYYYNLLVLPPEHVEEHALTTEPKRHVTYIIDTSGSMDGPSIKQARKSLINVLDTHNRDDLFNIIEFNSVHRKFYEFPLQATEENIKRAQKDVKELHATGGTMMLPALQEAFVEPLTTEHLRQVVFITDGAIGYENEIAKIVSDNAQHARFFGIGIGSAPNAHLMETIAAAGRGASAFIHDFSQIEKELATLFKKMKAPVQTDLKLVIPDGVTAEIIPAVLPDLLAGDPISINVKSKQDIGTLILHGKRDGKKVITTLKTKNSESVAGVSKLYARKKIADLSFTDPMHSAPLTKSAITRLGIEHQLLTQYTSFVAVDEKVLRPDLALLNTKTFDPTLPKGWQADRIAAREASQLYKQHLERLKSQAKDSKDNPLKHEINLPQTATGYDLLMMLGLFLMLIFGTRSYRIYRSEDMEDCDLRTANKIMI